MHTAAHQWVAASTEPALSVLDIGGRNINGTVRGLFPDAVYTTIDLEAGPNVDIVGDFLDYQHPELVEVVVCCEVAEHTSQWRDIIAHAADQLKPGGRFVFTAAGPGRQPHSGHDGGPLHDGEWYRNIDPGELYETLSAHFGTVVVDVTDEDVRAVAE